jgi:hypothetical protein
LAPLIRLYPYEIFVSCCFRKKFLSVQFLLFLDFAAYQKNKKTLVISFYFCSKYISSIKKKIKRKEKSKKKIVQKDVYWILPQKTKQWKI